MCTWRNEVCFRHTERGLRKGEHGAHDSERHAMGRLAMKAGRCESWGDGISNKNAQVGGASDVPTMDV